MELPCLGAVYLRMPSARNGLLSCHCGLAIVAQEDALPDGHNSVMGTAVLLFLKARPL